MAFNKNGETKIYKKPKTGDRKVASEEEAERYLVDDLIKDSEQKTEEEEEKKNVLD